MRLKSVETGDNLVWKVFFHFISMVSGIRFPDAARIVFYHRNFYGKVVSEWTQATMRGKSNWTVGERELMAAMVAKWNSCNFCIGAHKATATHALGIDIVESTFSNSNYEKVSKELKSILNFLEVLTKNPTEISPRKVEDILNEGISLESLEDAIAVAVLFNITVRNADTFDFEVMSESAFSRSSKRILNRGYGGKKHPPHPNHRENASILQKTVFSEKAETDLILRKAMAARASGGAKLEDPYEDLAKQIGESAYKVTDSMVAKVLKETSSEKKTFELIIASAVGFGLYQWELALRALEEAKKR